MIDETPRSWLSEGAFAVDSGRPGHPAPVVERRGTRAEIRYWLQSLALFGANRIVNGLPSHHARLAYYRRVLGWTIGPGSSIHSGLKIFGGRGRVRIGSHSTLQMDCLIAGAGMSDLTLGDNVAVAYRVAFILGSHDLLSPSFTGVTSPITLEDYVFVATGAMILQGVTLHEGTVVTAGSVVTKSTPPYSIVRGNPAQVVGRRPRGLAYSAEHFWPFH